MSISLTVNKFFDPVMNLAKSSLAKIYQVLPASAQKFFLGIATTKASPEVLKGLHADVSASEHAKALSNKLNQLLPKVGDTAVFFSDPHQAGPYMIPNAIQKALRSNPLPDELKAQFQKQGLNVEEYLSMALSPTHTGLVVRITPTSDNPEGLLFIHIDLRSQKPSKENLSPFNGEMKIEGIPEASKRAVVYHTDFEFFKVGHVENTTSFLTELKEIKKDLHYYVPTLFSRAVQILGNEKLGPSIESYLRNLTDKLPKQHLDSLRNSLLNIRLPAFSSPFNNSENNLKAIAINETQPKNNKVKEKIPPKMVCSDLVAHLLASKVKLDNAFHLVKSKLQEISQSPTPSNLYDTLRQELYQAGKIKHNSLTYSFA
ncbi:MAG: hypothetical protein EBR67_02465 [Proteobacteria bacterium]|nr:hypothetical protein [Pseudomonadota bacterium]